MKNFQRLAATAILGFAGLLTNVGTQAATVTVDVSGAQSINLQGEAGNTVWFVSIGANAWLTSLDWSVQLSAFAPSSLSEMQVSFGDSSGAIAINFAPGAADMFNVRGNYSGSLNLTGAGIAAGSDGLLRIEFSEAYKDFDNGVAEGQWVSGSLGLGVTAAAVPEPASAALLAIGLGLMGLQGRRARRG